MADIDRDGRSDLVTWRASTGTWYWLGSASGYNYATPGSVQWGNKALGDIPLLADMDGDGRSDLVIWRASTGTFSWLTSSTGYSYAAARTIQWGMRASAISRCSATSTATTSRISTATVRSISPCGAPPPASATG